MWFFGIFSSNRETVRSVVRKPFRFVKLVTLWLSRFDYYRVLGNPSPFCDNALTSLHVRSWARSSIG